MITAHSLRFCLAGVLLTLLAFPGAAADPTGEQIYRKQCAACHGANGEGTRDDYPHPLAGNRSIAQLTSLIAKTMPKDDPGSCKGDNAAKVSAYIYGAFYSRE